MLYLNLRVPNVLYTSEICSCFNVGRFAEDRQDVLQESES